MTGDGDGGRTEPHSRVSVPYRPPPMSRDNRPRTVPVPSPPYMKENNKLGNIMVSRLYDLTRWKRARRLFLQTHPLCRMCEQRGRVSLATTVDHVVPHRGDEALFWDEQN